jgi:DnaK suppressor protein
VVDGSASELLEIERTATIRRLEALATEFDGIVAASVGAISDDEHDPEGATIAFERERTSALRAQAEAHLREIEAAQARLAAGDYGTCHLCRRPIGAERLRALPVAEFCTPCAGVSRGEQVRSTLAKGRGTIRSEGRPTG